MDIYIYIHIIYSSRPEDGTNHAIRYDIMYIADVHKTMQLWTFRIQILHLPDMEAPGFKLSNLSNLPSFQLLTRLNFWIFNWNYRCRRERVKLPTPKEASDILQRRKDVRLNPFECLNIWISYAFEYVLFCVCILTLHSS